LTFNINTLQTWRSSGRKRTMRKQERTRRGGREHRFTGRKKKVEV